MIWLQWIGNLFICIGMWQIGSKKRIGFLVQPFGNLFWIYYSAHEGMWAMCFICTVFAALAR